VTKSIALVSTAWLQEKLETDDSVVVLEVSSDDSPEVAAGEDHVPGARFAFWKDLLWSDTDRQFPSPEVLAQRLSAMGISDGHTIAIVGDPVQYGTYAYWVLSMAGLESRTVLVDGGRAKWIAEGRDLAAVANDVSEGHLTPGSADESCRIGRAGVRDLLGDPSVRLLDVRSAEEFRGERVSPSWFEVDYGAERRGRIPGATHLYYGDLLHDDGTFRDPDELESLLAPPAADITETVTYCRLSHRATLAWFALTRILDRPAVRVYDGSWTEWGSIVGYPIER
jgi:thiosulfate/3-mercaptopyruvate sulfurtransferase